MPGTATPAAGLPQATRLHNGGMTTTQAPKRLVVVVNPSASFGRHAEVGPRIIAGLLAAGHQVTALQEASYRLVEEAARAALADRPDALVVVGGDGMVHLGVNLLVGTEVPLGLVASGTGNDLAQTLGLPIGDPAAALAALLAALEVEPQRLDLLEIDSAEGRRYAAGVFSAGFDALVNERANAMLRPKGASRYTIALLRELAALVPRRYELIVDGEPRTVEALLISVANNTSFGGGMKIAPEASMQDGMLDLFVVTPLSRTRFLAIFPRVFKGTHVGNPAVRLERVRSVRLATEGDLAGYADGERVGLLPAEVRVRPGALRMLVP